VHKIPKVDFNLNIEEIDNIVFSDTIVRPTAKKTNSNPEKVNTSVNRSTSNAYYAYEEEESYENPINISKMPGGNESYIDIKSDYCNETRLKEQ